MKEIKLSIDKESLLKTYLKNLEDNLYIFKELDGVIGLTLNGGLSRGYGDHLSEIDITIFLDDKTFKKWELGYAPITTGITKINSVLYDIKYVNYSSEKKREWSTSVELWDLSYAKILYDPQGLILELHKEKLERKTNINQISGPLFDAWWNYKLAGDIWIYREDYVQGHIMLNAASIALLKALFIANIEYIPHDKWLVHMTRNLNWRPNNWSETLSKLFSTGDMSKNSLIERQKTIDSVWKEIDRYVNENYFNNSPVSIMEKYFYDLLLFLFEEGNLSTEKWKEKANLSMLNIDPFSKVIDLDKNNIIFNIEKFNRITKGDMDPWFYKIVEAVRNK